MVYQPGLAVLVELFAHKTGRLDVTREATQRARAGACRELPNGTDEPFAEIIAEVARGIQALRDALYGLYQDEQRGLEDGLRVLGNDLPAILGGLESRLRLGEPLAQ